MFCYCSVGQSIYGTKVQCVNNDFFDVYYGHSQKYDLDFSDISASAALLSAAPHLQMPLYSFNLATWPFLWTSIGPNCKCVPHLWQGSSIAIITVLSLFLDYNKHRQVVAARL